jgi:hypothetical protein
MKAARRLIFGLSLFVSAVSLVLWLSQANVPVSPLTLALIAAAALGLAIIMLIWEAQSWRMPTPEDPPMPSRPVMPKTPAEKALDAMENARDVSSRTERKVRIRIDTEEDSSD